MNKTLVFKGLMTRSFDCMRDVYTDILRKTLNTNKALYMQP